MIPQAYIKLILLNELLKKYESGDLEIGRFLRDSRNIIDILEQLLGKEIDSLHATWFNIEQAYAISLDRNVPISEYRSFVNEEIHGMESQISFLLQH